MAAPSSGGASSLDVRLPERPAATFDQGPDAAEEPAAPPAGGQAPAAGATGATGASGAQAGTGTAAPAVTQPQP
jgi:hypothetical protein